jgi:hypothetical protein
VHFFYFHVVSYFMLYLLLQHTHFHSSIKQVEMATMSSPKVSLRRGRGEFLCVGSVSYPDTLLYPCIIVMKM